MQYWSNTGHILICYWGKIYILYILLSTLKFWFSLLFLSMVMYFFPYSVSFMEKNITLILLLSTWTIILIVYFNLINKYNNTKVFVKNLINQRKYNKYMGQMKGKACFSAIGNLSSNFHNLKSLI